MLSGAISSFCKVYITLSATTGKDNNKLLIKDTCTQYVSGFENVAFTKYPKNVIWTTEKLWYTKLRYTSKFDSIFNYYDAVTVNTMLLISLRISAFWRRSLRRSLRRSAIFVGKSLVPLTAILIVHPLARSISCVC